MRPPSGDHLGYLCTPERSVTGARSEPSENMTSTAVVSLDPERKAKDFRSGETLGDDSSILLLVRLVSVPSLGSAE